MRILGAILAGGQSRRFGSDKALAMLDGETLIERVRQALAPQVQEIAVCGRPWSGGLGVPDRPGPGLGPLGGLAAALHEGERRGFDAVLSAPCDTPFLPADLATALAAHPPCYVADAPVIGLWPTALTGLLDDFVANDPRRSMRGWAAHVGATPVHFMEIANVNAPEDLRDSIRKSR